MLGVQPAGLRADLEQADVRRVIDPQRRPGQPLAGLDDLRPAVLADAALAQLVALDPRLRGDEPLGELGLGHLQREQGDRLAVLDRRVLGDVRHQAALAHRRAGGQDDQVARLEAAGDRVEVAEARARPGQRRLLEREPVELVQLVVEDPSDLSEVLLAVAVRDLEHRLLGLLDDLPGAFALVEHARLDRVGRAQQAAHQGRVADDLRVVAEIRDVRHRARQHVDRLASAGVLEPAGPPQLLGDRQQVDRLALLVERRASPRRSGCGGRGRSPSGRSASSITSEYIVRSDSRIAPSTDCSASMLCGGVMPCAPRPGPPAPAAVAALPFRGRGASGLWVLIEAPTLDRRTGGGGSLAAFCA